MNLLFRASAFIFLVVLHTIAIPLPVVAAKSASETKGEVVAKSARPLVKDRTDEAPSITVSSVLSSAERMNSTASTPPLKKSLTSSDVSERLNQEKTNRTRSETVPSNTAIRRVSTTKKRSVRTSTILRLQKEWQQMILSGVAYDWYNQKPLGTKRMSTTDGDDPTGPCRTSHIWIGPITRQQWYVWHFTFTCHDIGNRNDNPYYDGVYHGRIVLSKDYPLRPPISIQLYTPNGRFIVNQKICFTGITHYHPDQWNTNNNIYSMIESLRYHMVTSQHGNEIGAVWHASYEQKKMHAVHSQSFRKNVPISYRSKLKPASNNHANRNVVIIDHDVMIRRGYVTVPRSIAMNTIDSTPG